MAIQIKRVYDQPEETDGLRVLVDRLWARGLSKERARIDLWVKDLAPSTELRRWYGHDARKWREFKSRYGDELKKNRAMVEELVAQVRAGQVTFLYSSTEQQLNNAMALKEYLERLVQEGSP